MDLKANLPSANYHEFSVKLGQEQICLVTRPDLPEWRLIAPSIQLLTDHASLNPTDAVLLYGHQLGVLGVYWSRNLPKCQLSITDDNYSALEMTRMTLEANDIFSVNLLTYIDLPEELYQKYDTVIIQIPKGRQLARRWLVQAYHALVDGGKLYLSGPNQSGIQSVIKDAQELYGSGRILAYKKGNRIAHFHKRTINEPQPDWALSPGIAPHTWVEFSIPLPGHSLRIRSLPGIFSFDHLDAGTALLLSVLQTPPGAHILDIGCGYGIIGLYAAFQGAGRADLVDISLYAAAACRETINLNCITNAKVFAGEFFSPVSANKYDLILSNPPFHSGHAVNYHFAQSMISQAYQALNPGGQVVIVANRFIRYDRLIKEIFGNVSVLTETGKFHVLCGLKSS
jgi:16S rRNA (guanine1207-N2)-methyltransferase